MDDETLVEKMLYTGEGTTVDYKVQQYPHDGATPEAKGELLKDVLAFANAWRQEDAHILIGVSDSRELVGLDKDLDDARLQQFINGKTNIPIHFSYRSLYYKGFQLGLYTIGSQERPVYAKQTFGKVLADTVYVRRGSSTAIAKPEEIAKMGADSYEKSHSFTPSLSLRLFGTDDTLLDPVSFNYKNIIIDAPDNLPPLSEARITLGRYDIGTTYNGKRTNPDYYRELASYIQQTEGIFGFRLRVTNSGKNFAADVRVYLTFPISENFQVIEEREILDKPKRSSTIFEMISSNVAPINLSHRGVSITKDREFYTAIFHLGKIQSGETLTTDFVYLVRPPQELSSIAIRILSDQLHEPIELDLPIIISKQDVIYTLNNLELF